MAGGSIIYLLCGQIGWKWRLFVLIRRQNDFFMTILDVSPTIIGRQYLSFVLIGISTKSWRNVGSFIKCRKIGRKFNYIDLRTYTVHKWEVDKCTPPKLTKNSHIISSPCKMNVVVLFHVLMVMNDEWWFFCWGWIVEVIVGMSENQKIMNRHYSGHKSYIFARVVHNVHAFFS
jgi:hypothetical protein